MKQSCKHDREIGHLNIQIQMWVLCIRIQAFQYVGTALHAFPKFICSQVLVWKEIRYGRMSEKEKSMLVSEVQNPHVLVTER
jgi:hypothetical protein